MLFIRSRCAMSLRRAGLRRLPAAWQGAPVLALADAQKITSSRIIELVHALLFSTAILPSINGAELTAIQLEISTYFCWGFRNLMESHCSTVKIKGKCGEASTYVTRLNEWAAGLPRTHILQEVVSIHLAGVSVAAGSSVSVPPRAHDRWLWSEWYVCVATWLAVLSCRTGRVSRSLVPRGFRHRILACLADLFFLKICGTGVTNKEVISPRVLSNGFVIIIVYL